MSAVGLAAVPIMLVFLEPDFGTALVYAAALAAVLFIAGARWLHLGVLGAVAVACAVSILWALPAVGVEVLKDYQLDRLTAFTDRSRDPAGLTYNANQSILAVGSGGLRGRGVENATQTNLDYLPEHATDFVFASLAEQRGFMGASLLLGLYLLLLWRGIRIISLARDHFSAIVAGGIVFALLFQIFVNVGMTMGIAPITGIPLPFVSLGGSSMIANLLAMGILLSIHARGRLHPRR
jgi:rod shape determining protein RodA